MTHFHQGPGPRTCQVQESGAIELYFYEELEAAERGRVSTHLRACAECAAALNDLRMIRTVLADRPDVAAPAGGDWSGFMSRLEAAIRNEPAQQSVPVSEAKIAPFRPKVAAASVRSYIGVLTTAALLTIVTIGVVFVARQRTTPASPTDVAWAPTVIDSTPVATNGLRSAGEKHFERSKLVVLGLAGRESEGANPSDWAYERQLATSLLNDSRLYRMAAEERGLTALASVMRDLELVLLETSMAEDTDATALGQIQRLIRKRGLIQKMDTVASAGM
jgi:hypothetical protein